MPTAYQVTLEDLFDYANIDDVSLEDGVTELTFTLRRTGVTYITYGDNLDVALNEAQHVLARELVLEDLQQDGLSDEDIDMLARSKFVPIDEFFDGIDVDDWDRGYEAGISDAARTQIAAQAAIASVQQPAAAAAGEPVDALTVDPQAVLDRYPLLYVAYAPVAIIQR